MKIADVASAACSRSTASTLDRTAWLAAHPGCVRVPPAEEEAEVTAPPTAARRPPRMIDDEESKNGPNGHNMIRIMVRVW